MRYVLHPSGDSQIQVKQKDVGGMTLKKRAVLGELIEERLLADIPEYCWETPQVVCNLVTKSVPGQLQKFFIKPRIL